MASRVFSLYNLFGARGANASTRPNSWAAVSMWRRFFKLQEEDERERVDDIISALDETTSNPILSDHAKEQMLEFKRVTNQRNMAVLGNTSISQQQPTTSGDQPSSGFQHVVRQHEEQILLRPDLSIGPDSMYVPQ